MGVYRQSVITNVGRSLAARVLAENKSMIFTQVKTSEYAYLEGTNIPSLTDLRDIVQAAAPSSAQVFNNSMVQVSARFDNDKIPRKYRIETIGLYARMDGEDDDILFSVNQAETPDEMPEHSDVSPSAFIYNIQVTIQNASEISFTTNPAGTATVQDILDLEFPQFDDSGGATGISSFPDFINRIKNKMDIYQFYRDLKAGLGYVLHKGQLVNNCESTATDKPLAAAVGKTLWDKIMETVSALAAHKTSGDHDGRYYTETEMDSKLGGKSDTGHTHDDRYYTETEVDNKLSGKSDTNHSHDSRYYTESEMDTKLNGKANSSHTHDDRYYTESEMNAKLSGKSDTSHGHSGMLTTSDIVNNCTSTATNKPLAAAQGKVLMDKYNQLNSDKLDKSKPYKQLWAGTWNSGNLTVPEFSDYNMFLIGSSSVPIAMIGFKFAGGFHAYGIDMNASAGQRVYAMKCNYSGNTLSGLETATTMTVYGGGVGTKGTFPVSHVIGLL